MKRRSLCFLLIFSMVRLVTLPIWAQVRDFSPVTGEMLFNPDPADWLMASRTYDWQRFSPLDQIKRDNVRSASAAPSLPTRADFVRRPGNRRRTRPVTWMFAFRR